MSYNSEHPRHHVVVPSPGAKEPLYSDDNEPSESIFEPRHARSGPDSAHISLADRHPPCSHLHASLLAFAQSSVTGYSLSPHSVSDSEVRRPSTFTSRPVDLVPVCPGSTVTRRQAASDEEHCDISDDDLASKSGGNDCDLICQTHRNEDNQSREPGEEVYMDVDRDTDSVDEAIEETLWSRSSSPCPATQEQNATAADDTSGRSPANPESSVKTSYPFWEQMELSLALDQDLWTRLSSDSEFVQSPRAGDELSYMQDPATSYGFQHEYNPVHNDVLSSALSVLPSSGTVLSNASIHSASSPGFATVNPNLITFRQQLSGGNINPEILPESYLSPSAVLHALAGNYQSGVQLDVPVPASSTLSTPACVAPSDLSKLDSTYDMTPLTHISPSTLASSYVLPQAPYQQMPDASCYTSLDSSLSYDDTWSSPDRIQQMAPSPSNVSYPRPRSCQQMTDSPYGSTSVSQGHPMEESSLTWSASVGLPSSIASGLQGCSYESVNNAAARQDRRIDPNRTCSRPLQKRKSAPDKDFKQFSRNDPHFMIQTAYLPDCAVATSSRTTLEDFGDSPAALNHAPVLNSDHLNFVDGHSPKKQRTKGAKATARTCIEATSKASEKPEQRTKSSKSQRNPRKLKAKEKSTCYPCEFCFKIFYGAWERYRHQRDHCKMNLSGVKGVSCPRCDQHLSRNEKSLLDRHMASKKCAEQSARRR
ncbi:hypothetical protein NEOLEDRAFT_1184108 [Neolentinus lepideus HHB14362 ss-1]|uniref:C2H2-type domain-containing protein n=1 Tax=Neolentinus lepideus HHB14362 ss-1 TaxID=1314782 RepID=A0A165MQS7_9AGAM|nr:hypothetical protein NEOLEDRAFT_1184108 [Neolentinus lepideus HHB14362 ss-1]